MRISIIIFGLCTLCRASAAIIEEKATSVWDMIPVISQGKSVVQLIFGDTEGAKKTQEKFLNEGLITSQLRSTYFLITGEPKTALNIQEKFVSNLEGVVDSLPLVGHIKGGVHLLVGDKEHGLSALKSSTSTTGAIVGGVFGGPVGAIGGHLLMDGIITGADAVLNGNHSQPHGLIDYAVNFKNLKPGDHFDVIAGLVFDTKAAKKVASKTDLLNNGQIHRVKSAGSHELTPLIESEKLKINKRVVGMQSESGYSNEETESADETENEETESADETENEEIKKLSDLHACNELNLLKYNRFTRFMHNDLTYKDLDEISFLIPDVARNSFENTRKYEYNFYLDKLNIDSLRKKLMYLTNAEKSLIQKYDFRYVDNTPNYHNGFICSLATVFETDAETVQNFFSEHSKYLDGTNAVNCLQFLENFNMIKFELSDRINTIEELNKYLLSNKRTLENKHIIIEKLTSENKGYSVILKHTFDKNDPDPVILFVDYKYPGIIKLDTPNPYRFRSYIDTNQFDHFILYVIEKMF